MRAVIICGGNVGEYIKNYLKKDDFVICADSGYDAALAYGIKPDVVIGDMDSVKNEVVCDNKLIYPTHKDYTDSELCVKYVKEHNFDEAVMFGMIGTRMDHTLANLSLLRQMDNMKIIDDHNEIVLSKPENEICGNIGDTLSIIPTDGDVLGVSTYGLEYELSDGCIKMGTSLGVSNVMTKEVCKITIKKGTAFIIRSKD